MLTARRERIDFLVDCPVACMARFGIARGDSRWPLRRYEGVSRGHRRSAHGEGRAGHPHRRHCPPLRHHPGRGRAVVRPLPARRLAAAQGGLPGVFAGAAAAASDSPRSRCRHRHPPASFRRQRETADRHFTDGTTRRLARDCAFLHSCCAAGPEPTSLSHSTPTTNQSRRARRSRGRRPRSRATPTAGPATSPSLHRVRRPRSTRNQEA